MTKLPSFLSSMFPASSGASPSGKKPSAATNGGAASPRSAPASTTPRERAKDAGTPSSSSTQQVVSCTQALTKTILQESMEKVAASVEAWNADEFVLESLLQEAVRNHGRVDLMKKKKGGPKFAVKRMPTRWVREGPTEFAEQYPSASERPWVDLGLVRHLNSIKYPYVCDLLGVFRDDENTYVSVSLATQGDLFSWCDKDPKPGPAREEIMVPIAVQIFSAVRMLHELGVAHRDLSLENILLTDVGPGEQRIKLIDFGMSTVTRICRREVRGKQSYQAPEMHTAPQYDAFLADGFALGVVLFAMAVQDYPWTSTKKNTCQLFEYITTFGFLKFLKKRKLRKGTGEHLSEVFSTDLADLLQGFFQVEPTARLSLGESCYGSGTAMGTEAHSSAWDHSWIKSHRGASRAGVLESI
eukprot:gb/GFBE01021065.1/.p1 GENE.gb/GFBE01021065.1/~~gb/GFBE01021065.1/.p1  ORF type:complete len:414 (+),score=66.83 gb/GFBE01021065.1/:1-1242(+)